MFALAARIEDPTLRYRDFESEEVSEAKLNRECNIFECPHWTDMKCTREGEPCIFASDEWMETPQKGGASWNRMPSRD